MTITIFDVPNLNKYFHSLHVTFSSKAAFNSSILTKNRGTWKKYHTLIQSVRWHIQTNIMPVSGHALVQIRVVWISIRHPADCINVLSNVRNNFCSRFLTIRPDKILGNQNELGQIIWKKSHCLWVLTHDKFLFTIYVLFLSNQSNSTCFNFNINLKKMQNYKILSTCHTFIIFRRHRCNSDCTIKEHCNCAVTLIFLYFL